MFKIELRIRTGREDVPYVWRPMRSTRGFIYEFATWSGAAIMACACYPDTLDTDVRIVKGRPCRICGRAIDDRYPQFTECTTCAVAVNTEAMIPWRTTQREIARQRIAEMKARLQEEGEHV